MELGLALTLCGLGTAFLIPAVILAAISGKRKRSCTAKATARVIDIETRRSSDSLSFHPVYEYYIEGIRYTGVGAYMSQHVPQIGTTVLIMYNPSNPKKSFIEGYDNKIFQILTLVFGVIGCIPIIVCACIAVFE